MDRSAIRSDYRRYSSRRRFAFGPVAKRCARGVAGVILFLLIAEFVTRLEIVPPIYLPRVSTVIARLDNLIFNPAFLWDIVATLYAWAIGLIFASVLGVAFGTLIGSSEIAYRMTSPVIEFLRPIPPVAVIPLGMILWGQGLSMKVILVAYATLWPILYNTIYGVHDVDPVALQTGRSFNLGSFAVWRRITLPSAAPFVFTGFRVAASMGLIVIVGTELLASAGSGIGSFILFASSNGGQMDTVLAAATIAGIIGVAVNGSLAAIEQRLFRWHYRHGD